VTTYCTLAQVKSQLGISDTLADEALALSIESASRMIDAECNRVFFASGTATARVFATEDDYSCDVDDLTVITEVATDDDADGIFETVWATTDYQTEPLNGLAGGNPFPVTRLRAIGSRLFPTAGREALVRVTGTYGFTPVPAQVTQACVLQAARLWKRADAVFGVAGFGDLGAVRVSRTDPDVAALIAPFKKIAVG
jgi:hypothetical protein